ncbi:MAG: hypothetical protein K2M68_00985 [Muribaculaceae bacterium]|nr:hypothetical protein [Muribaculaceae bacterium]
MEHIISISPEIVRARVQATSALHAYMHNPGMHYLTDDDNPALNQAMTSALRNVVLYLSSWVKDFTIKPDEFAFVPDELQSMDIIFDVPDTKCINWQHIFAAVHEYMSDYIMGELWADCPIGTVYAHRADGHLTQLTNAFSLPATGSMPRIRRCY